MLLKQAMSHVPALKYALGIVGITAAIALIRIFFIDLRLALIAIIIMLLLMTVLFLFARLTSMAREELRPLLLFLSWSSLLLTLGTVTVLLTSVFFKWPADLQYWLAQNTPNSNSNLLVDNSNKELATYLRGQVVDQNDNALEGVRIEVEGTPSRIAQTTSDGGFNIDKIPGQVGDRARIFLSKDGYKKHNEYVALPGPVRIKLEKVR
jgi:hypothetical protein